MLRPVSRTPTSPIARPRDMRRSGPGLPHRPWTAPVAPRRLRPRRASRGLSVTQATTPAAAGGGAPSPAPRGATGATARPPHCATSVSRSAEGSGGSIPTTPRAIATTSRSSQSTSPHGGHLRRSPIRSPGISVAMRLNDGRRACKNAGLRRAEDHRVPSGPSRRRGGNGTGLRPMCQPTIGRGSSSAHDDYRPLAVHMMQTKGRGSGSARHRYRPLRARRGGKMRGRAGGPSLGKERCG